MHLPPTTIGDPDDPRFANGLSNNADGETCAAFFKCCVANYRRMEWKGSTLSEYFADDFESFSENDFNGIPNNDRRTMRDLLRKRGVYVKKGRGIKIAEALTELVQGDQEWPADDPEKPSNETDHVNGECPLGANVGPHTGSDFNSKRFGDVDNTPRNDRRGFEPMDETHRSPSGTHSVGNNPFYRNNIPNLSKAYFSDKDRYSGFPTDNFDRKLCLFNERCDQAGIPDDEKHRAFSIMLTGRARDFYFDHIRGSNCSFNDMTSSVKRRFITAEHVRTLVREWDSLTLEGIMSENVGKPSKFCLEELVSRMHSLQSSLPAAYANEERFKNKLLNAVKDVDACKLAYFKPAPTVEGLISDLHSSLAIDTPTKRPVGVDAHFVDRRYRGQRGRFQPRKDSVCIVCQKKGCWSTNHPKDERLAALRKNKHVRQFFTSISNDDD